MDVKGNTCVQGLWEQAEFYAYHPIVNFCYFLLVIGIAMFSNHPVFLGLILIIGCCYSGVLKGRRAWKTNAGIILFMFVVMSLVNAIFTHNGVTTLFYLNGNRVTLEAIVYGMVASMLFSSVIIWFGCFLVIMSSDKFIYLFGRIVPVLALTLSMIFRFIPLFKARFTEIHNGQKCMGRGLAGESWIRRARQFCKEVSILIAWSLESSIETSDSMGARGYGLKGRTSFHLYHFTRRDGIALGVMLVLGVFTIVGCVMGKTSCYYYPGIWIKQPDIYFVITLVSYLVLMIIPMIIDIKGEQKWKQLNFEM